jgi:outer membrane protein assembly factor BamB
MFRVTPRRRALLIAAPLVGLLAISLAAGSNGAAKDQSSADWAVFRGNPLQTGVAASPLPERLEARWTFRTKESVEAAAAVVAGTVYVGSLDEHLYALNLQNGGLKWKYKGGPFKAPPSFHQGAVYVGDEDGRFHCVDAATGKKRWTFETGAEITSGANFAGGNVLFGSGDEHLYCLSRDGKLQWKFKVPGGPVMASPAVVGDRTFVAGCDSTLHVIDIKNGKQVEAVDIGGQTGASTAVAGDRLYVGTMNNQVLAIDWKKAKVVWTFEPPQRPQPFFASAAVTDRLVIAGSRDKLVHALGRKDGREVWSFPTRGKVDSSPVVVGRRVFFGSLDGSLYAVDVARGTLVKKFDLGKGIVASPAVAEGRLVIGTQGGVVYCFGKK